MKVGLKKIMLGADPARTLIRMLFLAAVTILLLRYVLLPVRLRGASMEPTFLDGSWHLANLLEFRRHGPDRGDVVMIRMAGRKAFFLKRIVGLPGETVTFTEGRLLVNGTPIPEVYVQEPGRWTIPAVQVGTDEYYVAGDNRQGEWQWHMLGTVKRDRIMGGLWF